MGHMRHMGRMRWRDRFLLVSPSHPFYPSHLSHMSHLSLHLFSIDSSTSLFHPAEIEGKILRDSELAAQIVYLFGVERADDVDDHDLFRVGDQHADAFDYGAVVDHQEDLDVFSLAFAAHADDAIPARRGELLANRFDIAGAVFAVFVQLHALALN